MEHNDQNNIENRPPKHPFTVPEGYFNDLPMQIQQRVQAKPKQSVIFRPLLEPKFRLSAVLGVLLILATGIWFSLLQQQHVSTAPISLAQLSDQEIYQYLESDYYNLETSDLALLTGVDDQLHFSLPAYTAPELENEIDVTEIEDYYFL